MRRIVETITGQELTYHQLMKPWHKLWTGGVTYSKAQNARIRMAAMGTTARLRVVEFREGGPHLRMYPHAEVFHAEMLQIAAREWGLTGSVLDLARLAMLNAVPQADPAMRGAVELYAGHPTRSERGVLIKSLIASTNILRQMYANEAWQTETGYNCDDHLGSLAGLVSTLDAGILARLREMGEAQGGFHRIVGSTNNLLGLPVLDALVLRMGLTDPRATVESAALVGVWLGEAETGLKHVVRYERANQFGPGTTFLDTLAEKRRYYDRNGALNKLRGQLIGFRGFETWSSLATANTFCDPLRTGVERSFQRAVRRYNQSGALPRLVPVSEMLRECWVQDGLTFPLPQLGEKALEDPDWAAALARRKFYLVAAAAEVLALRQVYYPGDLRLQRAVDCFMAMIGDGVHTLFARYPDDRKVVQEQYLAVQQAMAPARESPMNARATEINDGGIMVIPMRLMKELGDSVTPQAALKLLEEIRKRLRKNHKRLMNPRIIDILSGLALSPAQEVRNNALELLGRSFGDVLVDRLRFGPVAMGRDLKEEVGTMYGAPYQMHQEGTASRDSLLMAAKYGDIYDSLREAGRNFSPYQAGMLAVHLLRPLAGYLAGTDRELREIYNQRQASISESARVDSGLLDLADKVPVQGDYRSPLEPGRLDEFAEVVGYVTTWLMEKTSGFSFEQAEVTKVVLDEAYRMIGLIESMLQAAHNRWPARQAAGDATIEFVRAWSGGGSEEQDYQPQTQEPDANDRAEGGAIMVIDV